MKGVICSDFAIFPYEYVLCGSEMSPDSIPCGCIKTSSSPGLGIHSGQLDDSGDGARALPCTFAFACGVSTQHLTLSMLKPPGNRTFQELGVCQARLRWICME